MKVMLSRTVKIDGTLYNKGVSMIPEAVMDHWYFNALEKDGVVKILGARPSHETKSPKKKAKPSSKGKTTKK